MSETMSATEAADRHPIGLIVTDDLRRNRLTVFFRLLLSIPHFVVLFLWGIVAYIAVLIAWIVGIFMGRVPDGLHNFIASYLTYMTRVSGYFLLLADPFPPFGSGGSYPIDLRVDAAQQQNRLTIFFRMLLAIPALILAYVFNLV